MSARTPTLAADSRPPAAELFIKSLLGRIERRLWNRDLHQILLEQVLRKFLSSLETSRPIIEILTLRCGSYGLADVVDTNPRDQGGLLKIYRDFLQIPDGFFRGPLLRSWSRH
jgi:hypothetical protein